MRLRNMKECDETNRAKQVGEHRNDSENERHPNGCDVSVWFVELLAVLRENHPNRTTD